MPVASSPKRTPNPAGVYRFLLSGTRDQRPRPQATIRLLDATHDRPPDGQATRRFLARAIRYLTSEGIGQFLHIGSAAGPPIHQVAQRANPAARLVYAGTGPQTLTQARALLASTPHGRTGYIDAGLADPGRILAQAARTLDPAQPTAILLPGILSLLPNSHDLYAIVATLTSNLAPGGYLAISNPASDIQAHQPSTGGTEGRRQITCTRDEVAAFFTGLLITDPGIVHLNHWRPDPSDTTAVLPHWAGLGRKDPAGRHLRACP